MTRTLGCGLSLFAVGCAALSLARSPRLADCPGGLIDTAQIPGGDFVLRERVRIAGGDVDQGLELLVERRGPHLVVVAFNGFGARIFSVVQRGLEVEIDSPLGRALSIPPQNALRDLHQARFVHSETGQRVEVRRPGCDYTATFVQVERRALR